MKEGNDIGLGIKNTIKDIERRSFPEIWYEDLTKGARIIVDSLLEIDFPGQRKLLFQEGGLPSKKSEVVDQFMQFILSKDPNYSSAHEAALYMYKKLFFKPSALKKFSKNIFQIISPKSFSDVVLSPIDSFFFGFAENSLSDVITERWDLPFPKAVTEASSAESFFSALRVWKNS